MLSPAAVEKGPETDKSQPDESSSDETWKWLIKVFMKAFDVVCSQLNCAVL